MLVVREPAEPALSLTACVVVPQSCDTGLRFYCQTCPYVYHLKAMV